MDLIGYFLRIYFFKRYLSSPKQVFVLLGAIALAAFQGLSWVISSNCFFSEEEIKYVKISLLITLSFLTLIRVYFPLYTPLKSNINIIYPVSKVKKYFIENMKDWCSFYFVVVFFVLIFLPLFSKDYSCLFSLKLLFLSFSFNIIRRIIQSLTERKILFSPKPFLLIFLFLSILIPIEIFFPIRHSGLLFDVVKLCLLFIIGTLIEYDFTGEQSIVKRILKRGGKSIRSLFWRNKMLRLATISFCIMKVCFLFNDVVYLRIHGTHFFYYSEVFPEIFCDILLFILVCPILLFMYYNNLWGYNRNLFLTVRLRTDDAKYLFLQRIRLLIIPLSIDFFITILYWVSSGCFNFSDLILYIASAIILFFTGFYSSLKSPDYMTKNKHFQSKSAIMANVFNLLLIILIFLIVTSTNNVIVISLLTVVCIGICYVCTKQAFKIYTNESVYLKLFKS